MRTPNTWWDTRESGRKSSGKFLWPALGTAAATSLIIALSCSNGNDATKPHTDEWNRDSVKTWWVNPSLKPWQWRWRWWKARMYKDDKWTHFVLTESEVWTPSSVNGTYYPEKIRELTITPDWDTTGKYTMNHRDLIFFSPKYNYITEAKADTLSKIKQLFSKTIPEYRYPEFNYEFWDLDNPKPRLSKTDKEENGED